MRFIRTIKSKATGKRIETGGSKECGATFWGSSPSRVAEAATSYEAAFLFPGYPASLR